VAGGRTIKANFLNWNDLFDSLDTVIVYHGLGMASYNIVLSGNASELPPEVEKLEIWSDTESCSSEVMEEKKALSHRETHMR
jgi:hypothetical protein